MPILVQTNLIVSNQSGTGKGCPSQNRMLIKTRREVKLLEESLRKKEKEKLKEELAALRQSPKWAKANRSEEQEKKLKKKGPKFGHKAHPRTLPLFVDREVGLIPKHCSDCNENLPEPSKWHTYTQIDIPPLPKPLVTLPRGMVFLQNLSKRSFY